MLHPKSVSDTHLTCFPTFISGSRQLTLWGINAILFPLYFFFFSSVRHTSSKAMFPEMCIRDSHCTVNRDKTGPLRQPV